MEKEKMIYIDEIQKVYWYKNFSKAHLIYILKTWWDCKLDNYKLADIMWISPTYVSKTIHELKNEWVIRVVNVWRFDRTIFLKKDLVKELFKKKEEVNKKEFTEEEMKTLAKILEDSIDEYLRHCRIQRFKRIAWYTLLTILSWTFITYLVFRIFEILWNLT